MISDWSEGFQDGYNFCKMLSEVESYKGKFWPDRLGAYRSGFAEGTKSGSHKYKVNWKWTDDGTGNINHVEKI